MSERFAELANCICGCGYRQCRRYRGVRLCRKCWKKREAIVALLAILKERKTTWDAGVYSLVTKMSEEKALHQPRKPLMVGVLH